MCGGGEDRVKVFIIPYTNSCVSAWIKIILYVCICLHVRIFFVYIPALKFVCTFS